MRCKHRLALACIAVCICICIRIGIGIAVWTLAYIYFDTVPRFPSFLPSRFHPDTRALCKNLLQVDVAKRFGVDDALVAVDKAIAALAEVECFEHNYK